MEEKPDNVKGGINSRSLNGQARDLQKSQQSPPRGEERGRKLKQGKRGENTKPGPKKQGKHP